MEDMDWDLDYNLSEEYSNDYLFTHDLNLQVSIDNFFESDFNHYEPQPKKSFKVLSWNIDGLDEHLIDIRINAILTMIKENQPDFIFFQEIIPYMETIFQMTLESQYEFFIDSGHDPYYCGILIKKSDQIKIIHGLKVIKFEGSQMGRSLLSVTVNVIGLDIKLMTSHLESMKNYSDERKVQLCTAFNEMNNDAEFSIFAGDMNVRNFELQQIHCPPNGIVDVSEYLFKDSNQIPTWEPKENRNISQSLSMIPGMRFDRMYFYSSVSDTLKPVGFQVLGKQLISGNNLHPSDHWAILGVFSLN